MFCAMLKMYRRYIETEEQNGGGERERGGGGIATEIGREGRKEREREGNSNRDR